MDNKIRDLFFTHCYRKCKENCDRGCYSVTDVKRFLHNVGLKYNDNDIKDLQKRLFEFNVYMNNNLNSGTQQTIDLYKIWLKDKYKDQYGGYFEPGSPLHVKLFDFVQLIMDIVGFIPVYGEPVDIINGFLSLLRQQYWDAFFSFLSAIPFVDFIAKPIKFGKHIIKYVKMRKLGKVYKAKSLVALAPFYLQQQQVMQQQQEQQQQQQQQQLQQQYYKQQKQQQQQQQQQQYYKQQKQKQQKYYKQQKQKQQTQKQQHQQYYQQHQQHQQHPQYVPSA